MYIGFLQLIEGYQRSLQLHRYCASSHWIIDLGLDGVRGLVVWTTSSALVAMNQPACPRSAPGTWCHRRRRQRHMWCLRARVSSGKGGRRRPYMLYIGATRRAWVPI